MGKQKRALPFLSLISVASLLVASCAQTPPTSPPSQPAQPGAGQATQPAGQPAQPAAGQATQAPAGKSTQPAAGPPRRGGTVTEAGFADVKNLNPIFENDTASGRITDRVFEGLVEVDPKTGEPIPWLAESWDISPDGLKYTYKLRKGVSWSDGRPFTAHDVKFTWEAILDPKTETVYKSTFDRIAGAKDKTSGKATETTGIRVVDDYTLEVTLNGPD